MRSSFRAKYLEALKTFDDWVIISEWAKWFLSELPASLIRNN